MPDKQVKSRQRVADHGEVFTNEREVKAMCDLVKGETERIDSRFLEPACGEGAFLTEILRRKLATVKAQYGKSPDDYERYAFLAVTSLYGVDILPDNVAICRQNLFEIWDEAYTANNKSQTSDQCREAVKFVLQKNILCGDALTLKQADGTPIQFAQWELATGNYIKRLDYKLDELLSGHNEQPTLKQAIEWKYDEEIKAYIPAPCEEYKIIDYREVMRGEQNA